MFDKRLKGTHMAKRISYAYLLLAVLTLLAGILLNGYTGLIISGIFYGIMFIVIYLISTRFSDSKNIWIYLIICAIITAAFTLSLIGIVLAILLIVSANDIRKELD